MLGSVRAGMIALVTAVSMTTPAAFGVGFGTQFCYDNATGPAADACALAAGSLSDCLSVMQESNGIWLVDTDPSDQCAGDERTIEVDPPPKYPVYLPEGFVGEGTIFPAANSDTGTPPCNWTPHNPHFSSGANGVIAKATWDCDAQVSYTYYYLTLFNCNTSSPTGSEGEWVTSGQCYVATKPASGTIQEPGNSAKWPVQKRVRYVPKKGDPPGRTNGWYIECVQWYFGVGGHEYRGGQIVSQPVHITGF